MHGLKYFQDQVELLFAREQFMAEPAGLYAPIDYTLRLGGKRIRPTLLLVANAMFGGDERLAEGPALGIEAFHNFTLLHDDLMDRSPLRRGQPTVYKKWDENTAILSGDTMFALAWRYFLRLPFPRMHEALRCFCETAVGICEGQQYDMDFEQSDTVSLDNYMQMIRLKTAILLAGALKIGALTADAPADATESLYQFGIHLGLAFQLQDDLLDAYGDPAVFGKTTGQDIRDNKKTFLPLLALTVADAGQVDELSRLFGKEGEARGEEKVRRVMALYDRLSIRERTEEQIASEFGTAMTHLSSIPIPEADKAPLIGLAAALQGRKK